MIDTSSVSLTTLVKEFHLAVAHEATNYSAIRVTVADVSRPGMQLAGYFDHFAPERLQVLGRVETSYLEKLTRLQRLEIFDRLFSYKFPALLITRGIEPGEECLAMARKHDITVLRSNEATSSFVSEIITYMTAALAPCVTRHGVLMEIYGEGVLLMGESGIGKSETAIELVKRGHRLIADDAVEIKRVSEKTLVGSAPEMIRHYVELRGIGIVDVRRLFGMGAIKETERIDLVIQLENWVEGKMYERFGMEEESINILGINIPSVTVPVRPGRNLSIILEIAAMNNRQKRMGYNTALEFNKKLMKQMGISEE